MSSMISPQSFCDALCAAGADLFVGVPDSLLQPFCAYLQEHLPASQHVITANEGNAVAMAGGYHIATGRYGVVYLQNSGIGNAVNPLLSLADEAVYSLPMLLLIGYRGEPGVADEPQHVTQGRLTLPLLDTMSIPYLMLEQSFTPQLEACFAHLNEAQTPIALVVKKGTFAPMETTSGAQKASFPLTREEALSVMLPLLEATDVIVSTTGKTSRELFELREQRGESHAQDFLTVGSMGHTASIAMGMALGSHKRIYCLDGDGSFLMHLGSLAIAAQTAADSFRYILINNGAHESVGGQPTVALDLDVSRILLGMGFSNVYTAQTVEEIKSGMQALADTPKSALILSVKQGSRPDLGRPTTSPQDNKQAMMAMFSATL